MSRVFSVTGMVLTALSSCALASSGLTGDWDGARTELEEAGLSLEAEYTNIYQSAVSGVPETKSNMSHRFDIKAALDLEKLAGVSGGKLHTQLVARGGEANDFGYTALSVPNAGHYGGDEKLFFSSLYYSHSVSDSTQWLAGKIDAFELLRHAPFYGGGTRHGFMNVAFAAPPSGVTPPAFFGAIVNHTSGPLRYSAMLYDPRDRYTDRLGLEGAFKDGVNLSLGATYGTELLGRQSSVSASYTYSTEQGADFSSLEPDLSFSDVAKNKYNFRVQFSHNLSELDGDSSKAWGMYLRGALADGNPNIIEATFTGGLGGQALFFDRPMDSWGVGYYYYNLSGALQDSIADLPLPAELQDEHGVEAYYAFEVTPWMTLTLDAQYVTPALSTQRNVFLAGLRTNIRF